MSLPELPVGRIHLPLATRNYFRGHAIEVLPRPFHCGCCLCRPRPGLPPLRPRQVPPARPGTAHAQRATHGQRRPRPRLLADEGRLRHQGGDRRCEPEAHGQRDHHLPQPKPRQARVPLAAARPEHLRTGKRRQSHPYRHHRRQRELEDPGALDPAFRRRLPHHQRHRCGRRQAEVHHQQDHDAHRPAQAPGARRGLQLQGGLVVPHQRPRQGGRPQRLRALPRGGQLPLHHRAVLSSHVRLHGLQRMDAQAIPRPGRVHARLRRLHPQHHRAQRPHRGRHRYAAERKCRAYGHAARAFGQGPQGRQARDDRDTGRSCRG